MLCGARFAFVFLLCALVYAADRLLDGPPNEERHRTKPYILLIGVDGFRWDYAEKFNATNLLAFRARGSSAAGLIPSFPSSTFPNFYTMATGLRPQAHGMVSMHFLEPSTGEEFSYRQNGREGKWFERATPLWNLVEQEGMRTASYFWVGTDAAIKDRQPSAWHNYDASVSHETRVAKVLEWLRLPEERRPHLVTLYFSDVDTAGHLYSPESSQVREAVLKVDRSIGALLQGLESVRPAVDVAIVSDHGMATLNRIVDVTSHADFSGVKVMNHIAMVVLYSKDKARLRAIEKSLESRKDKTYRVYRRDKLPQHLHYRDDPRNGDLFLLSAGTDGIAVRSTPDMEKMLATKKFPAGAHGYDPRAVPEMNGIFLAAGPTFKAGVRLGAIENPGIFGLVATMLGVPIPAHADAGKDLVRALLPETQNTIRKAN